MRKLITSILLAVITTTATHAQDATTTGLVLQLTTGETATFVLDEQPKITFTADNLVITSPTYTTEYPLAGLQRYTFKQVPASHITSPTADNRPSITQTDGQIILDNLPAGTAVTVYSIDGMALSAPTTAPDGRATIDTSTLTSGVYIIKYGNKSLKIRKQ